MTKKYPILLTLKIYGVLAAIFLLPACTGAGFAGAPPTVKIGLVAPFEGLHRPLGYEVLFAVKLAVQERNVRGGVNGHQIELVALNDFDDPVEAQTRARALIADPDVLGVVGHLSAETTQAAIPLYRQADLAMSIPWSTAPLEGAPGVVSVAANTAETTSRLDTLSRERGYKQVVTVSNQLDANPFDVQAIVLDTEAVTAGDLILILRQADESLPLLGHVNVGSPQLIEVAAEAASGLVFVSPGPAPANVAGTEAFVEAYQALAGFAPGPRAVLAYDAANVLLDAIEQAMREQSVPPTRNEVSVVMTNITRQGLSGDIAFDTQGERVNAPVWVYRISEEGKYPGVLVTPEE